MPSEQNDIRDEKEIRRQRWVATVELIDEVLFEGKGLVKVKYDEDRQWDTFVSEDKLLWISHYVNEPKVRIIYQHVGKNIGKYGRTTRFECAFTKDRFYEPTKIARLKKDIAREWAAGEEARKLIREYRDEDVAYGENRSNFRDDLIASDRVRENGKENIYLVTADVSIYSRNEQITDDTFYFDLCGFKITSAAQLKKLFKVLKDAGFGKED
jgi:hypothetical protein